MIAEVLIFLGGVVVSEMVANWRFNRRCARVYCETPTPRFEPDAIPVAEISDPGIIEALCIESEEFVFGVKAPPTILEFTVQRLGNIEMPIMGGISGDTSEGREFIYWALNKFAGKCAYDRLGGRVLFAQHADAMKFHERFDG